MRSRKTAPILLLPLLLSTLGCDRLAGPTDRVGPYSLHCSQDASPQPTCIRFHAPSGAVRRLELGRILLGKADPDPSAGGSVYALTCRDFGLPRKEAGQASIQCLRLDTYSGEVLVVDATTAPPAL